MSTEVGSGRDRPSLVTKRVAKNTTYLAAADIAGKVMVFAFHVLAARRLGVERYGVLSFALAFTGMLGVLADLGLGTIATREIARDPGQARPQVADALTMRLVASVIIMVVIGVLANVLRYPQTTVRVVYICSACVLTNAVISFFCAVFQGFERMELLALNRAVQTAVLVVGALLLSRGVVVTERYAVLFVLAGLASVVVAVVGAVPLLGRVRLSFSLGGWWSLLRASIPVGMATVFTMFYYWAGTTLLSKMAGDVAVGDYSAAFRVANGLAFMGFAFSGAVYPLFSNLFGSNSEQLFRALELSAKYMAMLALPVAAFGALFSMPVVFLVYGREYAAAVPVLRLLVWWGALASVNSLLSYYLISVRRAGAVTAQTGGSLTVNLVLNFILIPSLGALGAAMAISSSEVFGTAYLATSLLLAQRRVRARSIVVDILRVIAALVVALPVAAGVARWNWAVGLTAGLTLYLALLFALRGIGSRDLQMLRWLRGSTEDQRTV